MHRCRRLPASPSLTSPRSRRKSKSPTTRRWRCSTGWCSHRSSAARPPLPPGSASRRRQLHRRAFGERRVVGQGWPVRHLARWRLGVHRPGRGLAGLCRRCRRELALFHVGQLVRSDRRRSLRDGDWTPDLHFRWGRDGHHLCEPSRPLHPDRQSDHDPRQPDPHRQGLGDRSGRIAGFPSPPERRTSCRAGRRICRRVLGRLGRLCSAEIDPDTDAASLFHSADGAAASLTDAEFTNGATLSFAATYERA